MKQTCPHCHRPFDDEWVVYCPVSRELAEKLRGDGLTTPTPVNMKLLGDDTIVITEIRVEFGSNHSPMPVIDGSIPGLPNHRLDPESGDYVSEPLRHSDGDDRG